MKLDRNINPDGRGKYALINMRTNKVEYGPPQSAQFFVIKYTDRFAAGALRGYSKSIQDYLHTVREGMTAEQFASNTSVLSLLEFQKEIDAEAAHAEKSGTKLPT